MNYYNEIRNKLIDNEIYRRVKDYSKERNRVKTYFEIGKLLNEAGSKYGESIIENYSRKLMLEVGKKYNKRTLFRMRQFYRVFSDKKVSAMLTQLSWSHCIELIVLKDVNKINYYINITIKNNYNYRQLHEKIKTKEYERLDDETKNKLINQRFNDLNSVRFHLLVQVALLYLYPKPLQISIMFLNLPFDSIFYFRYSL